MKLPGFISKVVDKVNQAIEDNREEQEKQAKLEGWKKRLQEAKEEHEIFRSECAVYDALYGGTKQVRPLGGADIYVSDRYQDYPSPQPARQVVNLVYQLIESQIDVNMPVPAVEPTEEADEAERRNMIEGQLTYMAGDTSLRRINSENERIVKKNGIAYFKVGYNPGYKAHTYRGRIETTNPHPCNVILQPSVFNIRDMDYLFHVENRTLDYICREYGEESRELLESENLEYGQLDYFESSADSYHNEKVKKLSVVEAWHKDKDGDICLLTWVGDTIIKDEPKFFYKRDEAGNIIEFDEIDIPRFDEAGNLIGHETVRVRCHVPDKFPFVLWYNIPREKSARGLADPYIVYDQQEGIKKLLSAEEEKQMKGTTKIFVRKGSGAAGKITDATLQVIETEDPHNDVISKDLKTPDNSLKDLYYLYVQAAKDALGITEASQGRTDGGKELSGRALEILAANTQGRMGVKADEKDIAYTELYRMWYDFLLAFADHRIPYRMDGQYNKPVYGYWDKSKLIKQDDAGEWYYPEFDIFVQAESALPKDKRFILDLANNAGNRIDNVEYWMLMESIGVPNASAILEMEQQKMQAQQGPPPGTMPPPQGMPPEPQMPPQGGADMSQGMLPPPGEQQGAEGQLPPELMMVFQALPPEFQEKVLQLPPNEIVAFLSQPPEKIAEVVRQSEGQSPQGNQLPPELLKIMQQLPPEFQEKVLQLPPDQIIAFLSQPPEKIAEVVQQATGVGEPPQQEQGIKQALANLTPEQRQVLMQMFQGGMPPGETPPGVGIEQLIASLPPEVQQIIAQLPPEQQAVFLQLLQTDPEQAMAMLQEVLGVQPQLKGGI